MAASADSFEEGRQQFTGVVDGNGNPPLDHSCFKLAKQSFAETGKHISPDDFPLVIKEATFLMGEEYTSVSSHGQDACTISVLPDEGNTSPKCDSEFTLLSFIKALLPSKNQMFQDTQLNCQKTQNCINVLLEDAGAYGSCLLDINVDRENSEMVKSHDEGVGSIKTESIHMQKVLQRQASLNTCERQASLSTDKAVYHDAPTNRWRKCKRAASFDSRKIVILFSILSSIGTLILIFLTLRVKQINDGLSHV